MRVKAASRECAFTLFEGLLIGTLLLLLLALLLPALAAAKRKSSKIGCVNCLKQDGIAFRIWEGDNNDKWPMAVSVTNGGAMELIATGNVAGCLQVMSNELATPRILYCPNDTRHKYAANFEALTPSNLSYFIGLKATELDFHSIVSGDANLIQNARPLPPGIWNLRTNATTSWTSARHQNGGNILLAEGSVQSLRKIDFTKSMGSFSGTNTVVLP